MISKLDIKDLDSFNRIGLLVNNNFVNLFKLEYIIDSKDEDVYGYYDNGELLGFVHVLKTFECLEIINVVVDIKDRKKGIATKLINYLNECYDDIEYILLEVNENNSNAISLYNKLGFNVINIRKKYYGNDDALIMRREVNV